MVYLLAGNWNDDCERVFRIFKNLYNTVFDGKWDENFEKER